MINLLPPAYKQEITFAKYNAEILKYCKLALFSGGLVALMLIGARIKLASDTARANELLAPKDALIKELEQIEPQAKALNQKLEKIKALRADQSHFSTLLADLAKSTPKGVFITSISLSGNHAKPFRIQATADSYESGVALREALATSPRTAEIDLESITPNQGGKDFAVNIVMSFKPGQAK